MVYPALLPLMRTPRLPVVDWTDAPADLNGLVRFAERRNLVSARVPSHFNWPLPYWHCETQKDYTDKRGNVKFIYTHAYETSYIAAITSVLLRTGILGILTPHCEILAKVLNKELPSCQFSLKKERRNLCFFPKAENAPSPPSLLVFVFCAVLLLQSPPLHQQQRHQLIDHISNPGIYRIENEIWTCGVSGLWRCSNMPRVTARLIQRRNKPAVRCTLHTAASSNT